MEAGAPRRGAVPHKDAHFNSPQVIYSAPPALFVSPAAPQKAAHAGRNEASQALRARFRGPVLAAAAYNGETHQAEWLLFPREFTSHVLPPSILREEISPT